MRSRERGGACEDAGAGRGARRGLRPEYALHTNELSDGVTEVFAYGTAVSSTPAPGPAAPGEPGDSQGLHPSVVCTSNELFGCGMQRSLGVVQGLTVRSRSLFGAIGAGLKSMVGGEVGIWTTLCNDTRQQAFERMLQQAAARGAKGVVAMRYDTNELAPGVTEVLAYGTAVSDEQGEGETEAAPGLSEHKVCTTNELLGHGAPCTLGIAQGLTVRSCNVVLTIGAGLKTVVGGEIRNWTALCEGARQEARDRMMAGGRDGCHRGR